MFICKGFYGSVRPRFGPNSEIDSTTTGLKTLNPLLTTGLQVMHHHNMGAPVIGSIKLVGYLVDGGERWFDGDFVAQWQRYWDLARFGHQQDLSHMMKLKLEKRYGVECRMTTQWMDYEEWKDFGWVRFIGNINSLFCSKQIIYI